MIDPPTPSAPYIRSLGQYGHLTVCLVDGQWIRDQSAADEQFTNSGTHFELSRIPYWQIWIDQGLSDDDQRFQIDNALTRWRYENEGVPYEEALDAGMAVERSERTRAFFASGNRPVAAPQTVFVMEAHRAYLGTVKPGLRVWLVHGSVVRKRDLNFTGGGNGMVYRAYMPRDEVWIDDQLSVSERPFYLIHEVTEWSEMSKGLPYAHAHQIASQIEYRARHDPAFANQTLKELSYGKPALR